MGKEIREEEMNVGSMSVSSRDGEMLEQVFEACGAGGVLCRLLCVCESQDTHIWTGLGWSVERCKAV